MGGIFINYRRQETAYIAGRLHDRLAAHFGPEMIFRDIDTIKPGVDFTQVLNDAVGACDAFVPIIGADWLAADERGRRRIDAPRDWVRAEIRAALGRPDVLVVPVLVEGARMPSEQELPAQLRKLARRNALELSDAKWEFEVQRLIAALEEVVRPRSRPPSHQHASLPPPPVAAPHPPQPQSLAAPPAPVRTGAGVPSWVKIAVPALAVALVAVLLLVRGGGDGGSTTATTAGTPATTVDGPWANSAGALVVTVERIEERSTGMRVHLKVENGTDDALTMPAGGYFTAVDDLGHSYEVDPFSREWQETVPPGTQRGVIDITEPKQPGATAMRMGWSTVFGSLDIDSIYITGITV